MSDHDDGELAEGVEKPPAGVHLMGVLRWVLLGAVALVALYVWAQYGREKLGSPTATAAHGPAFQCPMHPQVVSDFAGECPICHMSLEPITPERAAPPGVAGLLDDSGPAAYACPMHPEVRAARPARCPVCKMQLEPIADAAPAAVGPNGPAPGSVPPGTTPIALALDRVQSIGVRTALAEDALTSAPLRITAVVQPPEQGAAEVHVRTPGFVEAIRVDQTGIAVGAGQPMLTLYSPEILQAQHELLAMRAWGDAGTIPGAARNKLELLGMTADDVERVLAKREAIRAITIVAPRGGFVTKKNVVLGSYVTPETILYEIQDLSRVYVVADVFLVDAPHVKVGAEARFAPSGHPQDVATGKVDLVYPLVSPEARTRRVRMQIANAGGRAYSPGEYGTVDVTTPARRGVTIPPDALVDTGAATYVFVATGDGHYTPRVVRTTGSSGERIVIAEGLAAGERVVSGATFLIDSESRLRASVAGAAGHGKR